MDAKRLAALAVMTLFTLSACRAIPAAMFGGDPDAAAEPAPTPITKSMCESGADLSTDIDFLRSVEVSEDGLLTLLVSVDAALGEARTLTLLVGAEYAPLVNDVVVSLQDLRDIAEELERQDTIGGGIAVVGESVAAVGVAIEALGEQLDQPCSELTS